MIKPLFDIVSIGLPFGVFKITTGIYYESHILLLWGTVDILINIINFFIISLSKKKAFPTCLTASIGRIFDIRRRSHLNFEDIGEACDVLLSFIIVAWVIGSGAIQNFPLPLLYAWNISVILNVLGAGVVRLAGSFHRSK